MTSRQPKSHLDFLFCFPCHSSTDFGFSSTTVSSVLQVGSENYFKVINLLLFPDIFWCTMSWPVAGLSMGRCQGAGSGEVWVGYQERIFYLGVAEYWSRLLRKVAWIRHQACLSSGSIWKMLSGPWCEYWGVLHGAWIWAWWPSWVPFNSVYSVILLYVPILYVFSRVCEVLHTVYISVSLDLWHGNTLSFALYSRWLYITAIMEKH